MSSVIRGGRMEHVCPVLQLRGFQSASASIQDHNARLQGSEDRPPVPRLSQTISLRWHTFPTSTLHQPMADSLTCVVRRAHNTYGDRCFATAGPRVWNSLPAELQQCDSLMQFKRCLKTFFFGLWDYGALWLCVNRRRIEIVLLTYLLTYLLGYCDLVDFHPVYFSVSRDPICVICT